MESTTLSPSDQVPPSARATWTTNAVAEGPNTTSSLSQFNKSPSAPRASRSTSVDAIEWGCCPPTFAPKASWRETASTTV